ncbi:hypothetical protein Glove_382g5 [Diversispora epigaea]|uniref:Uncharacterized protein n=1 Tax=Diversispora epigaea TaxID=1348612 RepID=A0A397H854_9GLOM|nr:hypothetical protein Glove_382g5 [Diversispora epigaea]
MSENNKNNNTNKGNNNSLPLHLKKTYGSLTRRQKEIYNECTSCTEKIRFLEGLIEERKKSEIGTKIIGLVLYTLITNFIVVIYVLFFKDEKSTTYFVVLLNTVYYNVFIILPTVTITLANISIEIAKLIVKFYNKKHGIRKQM